MSTSSYDGHSSLETSFSYEGGRSLAGISEKKMKIEINHEKLFTVNITFQNVHVTLLTMNYLLTDVIEVRRQIDNFSRIAEL